MDHINLEPTPPLRGTPLAKFLQLLGGLIIVPAILAALVFLVYCLRGFVI